MSHVQELLERRYIAGSKVTNCVTHLSLSITERPDDCKLCLTDLQNHMNHAIEVNKWLNTWKEEAIKFLKTVR